MTPDRFWIRACIAILAVFAAGGLFQDLQHTAQGGAVDLRNRVTGARLAAQRIDPYSFKWKSENDELLCDPYNTSQYPLSRTTSTPFLLAFHVPVSALPYRIQQWTWLLIQYALLFAGFALWARGRSPADLEWGILFVLALCAAPLWRLHVDRGQIYILYAACFLALAAVPPVNSRFLTFCSSAGSMLLTAMRPVYLASAGVDLLRQPRRAATGLVAGAIVAGGLPVLICGRDIWVRYFDAMRRHSRLYLERFQDRPAPTPFPAEIEGIPFDTLTHFAKIPFADTSVYRIVSFDLKPGWLLAVWLLLMTAALYRTARTLASAHLWWAICAWAIIGDFLLPAFRNTYNDVVFLPLFLLGLTCSQNTGKKVWLAFACVFFASHLAIGFLPKAYFPAPSLIGLFIALAVAAATIAGPHSLGGWLKTAHRQPDSETPKKEMRRATGKRR